AREGPRALGARPAATTGDPGAIHGPPADHPEDLGRPRLDAVGVGRYPAAAGATRSARSTRSIRARCARVVLLLDRLGRVDRVQRLRWLLALAHPAASSWPGSA